MLSLPTRFLYCPYCETSVMLCYIPQNILNTELLLRKLLKNKPKFHFYWSIQKVQTCMVYSQILNETKTNFFGSNFRTSELRLESLMVWWNALKFCFLDRWEQTTKQVLKFIERFVSPLSIIHRSFSLIFCSIMDMAVRFGPKGRLDILKHNEDNLEAKQIFEYLGIVWSSPNFLI